MITRGAFNHLLRPGLRKDFRDSYKSHAEEFGQFLKVGNQDRAEIEAVSISGLPRMPTRGEVESVTFLDPLQSPRILFIDDEYALGFMISKRMMEDDQYGKANQNAKWLARSARLTQEYRAAEFLDDGFSGATFTGFAGETLISSTHSFLGVGGTWSNLVTGNPALGVTGLQAALDVSEQTKDHNNDPIVAMFNKLVINVADEDIAIKLTTGEKEPFTADNDVNAIMKKRPGLSYTVSHYKTQGNDWFFQDTDLMDSHFLFRVRPEFEDEFDFKTKAAMFTARQRINVYFYDPRGWIGSNAP